MPSAREADQSTGKIRSEGKKAVAGPMLAGEPNCGSILTLF